MHNMHCICNETNFLYHPVAGPTSLFISFRLYGTYFVFVQAQIDSSQKLVINPLLCSREKRNLRSYEIPYANET